MTPALARAAAWGGALALLAVAWPTPLHGDQALFLEMARRWHLDGALPYRDLWDLKPPAVHVFYRLAGALFGFSAQGVHTLEALLFIGYGVGLQRALGAHLRRPEAQAFAVLCAVGLPVAVAGPWAQSQVEVLAQPPLFAALWLALHAERARGWLAAGLAAGVVVAFKTPFLALVAGFWLLGAWRGRLRGARAWGPLVAGFAAPWLAAFGWATAHGFAGELAWTLFRFPAQAALHWPGDRAQLVAGASWAATRLGGLGLLAALGLWLDRRRPTTQGLGL